MTIFLSGGSKSGKSTLAQDLAVKLAAGGPLYYVATMIPSDEEDRERIRRHVENRAGMGFATIEAGLDLPRALEAADPAGTFLVDSVTALLLNEMFSADYNGAADPEGPGRCRDELLYLADWAKNAVFVSDWIYSDAERYDEFTENYRRSLAMVDRALAKRCDAVAELCAARPALRKGRLPE